MKFGTIRTPDGTTPVICINEDWIVLHQVSPITKGRDLLELITDGTLEKLIAPDAITDVPESSVISSPPSFGLPYIPRQIICVGRNYVAHAEELGNAVPSSPMLFNKLPSSCIADQDSVEIREDYGRVDFEGELAVVMGKPLKNARKDEVFDAILGYTLLNDYTARDIQQKAKDKGHPWLLAKSLNTFCPVGPYITTRDEIQWPVEVDIKLTVNGEIRQDSNTRKFIFDIPTVISYISSFIPLYPGDIIATGTPEGVSPIIDGDIVELTIAGLGTLSNPITSVG